MERRPIAYRGAATAALLLALTAGEAARQAAPTRPVTLAWDANDEPEVVGYIVYVGTKSRQYRETFDVGNVTSFTYPSALEGQRYFFAVSAYFEGPLEGPLSSEVSTGIASPHSRSSPPGRSSTVAALEAEVRRERARDLGQVTALTAIGDGRLFVIENSRRVRVIDATALVADPALTADHTTTRFTDLVVDPAFDSTGYVFVGVTEFTRNDTREFSIVRYREVQNALGEGAVVVSGLSLHGSDDPRFTVDDAGRIYVAMPASGAGRSDPYASYILRFNSDGSVPAGSRGASPVLAHGYAVPAALDWDRGDLWAVGADSRWPHAFARLALDSSSEGQWPKSPVAVEVMQSVASTVAPPVHAFDVGRGRTSETAGLLAFIGSAHRLYRIPISGRDDAGQLETLDWDGDEMPVAVAVGPRQELYVALRSADGAFSVVELK